MTNADIKFLFDMDESMTLYKLSVITGKTIEELKCILTCTDEEYEQ
jgi:hypothetical protein